MQLLLILFVVFVIGFSIYSEMTSSTLSKERFTLLLTLWWVLSLWILRMVPSAVLYFIVGIGLLVVYLAFLWNYSSFSRIVSPPVEEQPESQTGFRETTGSGPSNPRTTEQILQTKDNTGEYSIGNMLKTWQTLKTALPIL
jgi:hypothetical protein